jgi:hypothetical protein
MATGLWEDFTSKYGFSDGAALKPGDFEARSRLVDTLNDHPTMKSAGLRALEYDRPGLHNSCLVVVVSARGKEGSELLRLWKENKIADEALPSHVELALPELIADVYATYYYSRR